MNLKVNTKLIAIVCLLGTLFVGVLAGIYVDRTLLKPRRPFPSSYEFGGAPGRSSHLLLRNFSQQLDLTPDQHDQVTRILEKYRQRFGTIRRTMHPRYTAVRDSLHGDIRAILTMQQRERFDTMIHHYEDRHRSMRGKPR